MTMCIFNDITKHRCDSHVAVNKINIRIKEQRQTIPASSFAYTIENTIDFAVCNVMSRQ